MCEVCSLSDLNNKSFAHEKLQLQLQPLTAVACLTARTVNSHVSTTCGHAATLDFPARLVASGQEVGCISPLV